MGLHEERRDGPRGDEPDGFLFGQFVGEFRSFLDRYQEDQNSAKEFRKFIRDRQEDAQARMAALEGLEEKVNSIGAAIRALQDADLVTKEPRRWALAAAVGAIGTGGAAFGAWFWHKIHWG